MANGVMINGDSFTTIVASSETLTATQVRDWLSSLGIVGTDRIVQRKTPTTESRAFVAYVPVESASRLFRKTASGVEIISMDNSAYNCYVHVGDEFIVI